MRVTPSALLLILLLAAATPLAAGQGHEHEAGKARVVLVHDLSPDGYARVGNTAHFGFLLLNEEGIPQRHKDARLTLAQNGVVLFDSKDLHDYDGVAGLEYTFTAPGPYIVTAQVEGAITGVFTGTAHLPSEYVPASIDLVAPATARAGTLTPFTYQVVDANGTLLPHTDVVFEVRRLLDDQLVLRLHTHSHETAQELQVVFPDPGAYQVRLLGYNAFPTPGAPAFQQLVATHTVQVSPGTPTVAAATPEPVRAQAAAGSGGYTLFKTYDPDGRPSAFTTMRANLVVYDEETGKTVQHVNYEGVLRGPAGNVLLQTTALHEYDGILELVTAYGVPGTYTFDVTASRGNWSDSTRLEWTVLPPAVPLGAGYNEIRLHGADALVAGVPAELTFALAAAGGNVPFMHSEVDFQVVEVVDGPALVQTKVHTHGSGTMAFTVTFPEAGDYLIRVDPTPTTASASPTYVAGAPLKARYIPVHVAEGPGLPALNETLPEAAPADVRAIPMPGALAVGAVLAALTVASRRPRRS